MRGPWAAWKARRARRKKLDAMTKASARAWAQAFREDGQQVPPAFDLDDGEGLATVTQLRPGVRPAGTRRARHRRRPSA